MMWHRDNPLFYEQEKAEVETHFPDLRFVVEDNIVYVRGSFPLMFEGQELDRYSVELQLPRNHPVALPGVRETGGRVPRAADRHVNTDGTACVLLPDERWRLWPQGTPLLNYLKGPLHSFFLAQTMVEEGGTWPFGQWAHGTKGIFQYYCELLKTTDLRIITIYLKYLTAKKVKGHWLCPCGSNRRLRDCHLVIVIDLREKISRQDAMNSLEALKSSDSSAIEMTEGKPTATVP